MVLRRWQVAAALLTVVLVGCSGVPGGPPSPRAEPTLNPDLAPEVAEEVLLRESLGLRSDLEYVLAVREAPDSISHEMGLVVTPAEAAELDRRFRAQEELDRLAAYGAEHEETFGGMYIDQQAGGEVVLLFTDDPDRHRPAVSALAPAGVRVRVERVRFTQAELSELLEALDVEELAAQGHEMVSASLDTMRNVVTLEVKSNDANLERRLEDEHGGRLDVTVFPAPGPWSNTAHGDGWRLVAFGEAAGEEAYTVRAATDAAEWATMWEAIGLAGGAPEVDFASEVAVSFGHGVGSTCRELRLDGVAVDADAVYSIVSDPLAPRGCTSDLIGAAVFVVAVSRDALPEDGFTLRLTERGVTCGDECGFTEEIEVDLP